MKTVPRIRSDATFLRRVERMEMSEVKRCGQHNSEQTLIADALDSRSLQIPSFAEI